MRVAGAPPAEGRPFSGLEAGAAEPTVGCPFACFGQNPLVCVSVRAVRERAGAVDGRLAVASPCFCEPKGVAAAARLGEGQPDGLGLGASYGGEEGGNAVAGRRLTVVAAVPEVSVAAGKARRRRVVVGVRPVGGDGVGLSVNFVVLMAFV